MAAGVSIQSSQLKLRNEPSYAVAGLRTELWNEAEKAFNFRQQLQDTSQQTLEVMQAAREPEHLPSDTATMQKWPLMSDDESQDNDIRYQQATSGPSGRLL